MALRALRSGHGLLQAIRYSLPSSPLALNLPKSAISSLSEQSVFEELCELLPINPKPLNCRPIAREPVPETDLSRVSDDLLSPAEKLRGVFLQKLTGISAVESALSSTGVDLNLEIFADVVDKGSLGGAPMVVLFDWALKQPRVSKCVEIYNVILKALGRRKFFTFAEEVLIRMKADEIKPNSETLEILIDSFVSARRVSKAMELFGRLEEIGSKCDTESLTIIIRSLCRRSHIRVANSLFNKMKGRIPYDSVVYNEIIGGWARFGRVDKVETFWVTMVDDGFNPDKVSFAHLLEALGRAGRIGDAVDVFEQMKREVCCRDTTHYNAMISNYISVRDLDECLKYYKRMSADGCLPDRDTYDNLISAFIKVRRVADALELFDEMLGQGIYPSTGMVTSFIKPLCSFGPPHAAMVIYKKSRKAGCKISLKTYKLLLFRLSRFGKCGTVLKVWEEMQDSGHASDKEVYEYIVDGLCNIGRVDSAVLVVEESLRKGFCLSKFVFSKLNNKLLEMNKVETAYKLFLKVKDARGLANSQRFWRARGWHF
ncbi:TPR-like protein [Dioscorea alata]|uniref:TPR-like protein n=1 Tax=Dioscorea alata TaxID=55571 RepID=A0ACB7VTN4_DIOAL|nr:TPR-like protein [Dioscorea alata]